MRSRAQDSEEVIRRRLANAREELAHAAEFEYRIINKDFDSARQELPGHRGRAQKPEETHGPNHRRRLPEENSQPVPAHAGRDLPCAPTRAGASALVEPNRDKATVIALREIASGKVGTEVLRRSATAPSAPTL